MRNQQQLKFCKTKEVETQRVSTSFLYIFSVCNESAKHSATYDLLHNIGFLRDVEDAVPYSVMVYVNSSTDNVLYKCWYIADPPVTLCVPPSFTQGGLISAPLCIVGDDAHIVPFNVADLWFGNSIPQHIIFCIIADIYKVL